jgi:hypothetical protein
LASSARPTKHLKTSADAANRFRPKQLFTIGRATYGLKQSDYIGAIVVDTEHAGRFNRVIGSDISLLFTPRQQISAMVLSSRTGVSGESTKAGIELHSGLGLHRSELL